MERALADYASFYARALQLPAVSDKPIGRVELLSEAGRAARRAIASLVLGLGLGRGRDPRVRWDAGDMVGGALVGTCVFGAISYFLAFAKLVPRGSLIEAPRDVEVVSHQVNLSSTFWLIGVAALCLPVAWLFDRFEVGAFIVPGQLFGYAVASLAALVQISRWERTNGRRGLFEPDSRTSAPTSGRPLSCAAASRDRRHSRAASAPAPPARPLAFLLRWRARTSTSPPAATLPTTTAAAGRTQLRGSLIADSPTRTARRRGVGHLGQSSLQRRSAPPAARPGRTPA